MNVKLNMMRYYIKEFFKTTIDMIVGILFIASITLLALAFSV